MKKRFILTLIMVFVVGIFASAAGAAEVKGKGELGKNYLQYFAGMNPFADGASKIKATVGADGALKIEYELAKNGWMGAVSQKFQEDWSDFTGLTLKLSGGTGNKVRLELYDANGVSYQVILVDDAAKGKVITVPFTDFKQREDWQPSNVDTDKPFSLNPAMSLNISPLNGKGTITVAGLKLYK